MLGLKHQDYSDFNYAIFNQLSRLAFALIFFPIALYSLDFNQLNIWFLTMAIMGFGQSLVYGVAVTVVRFLSYTESGINSSEFNMIGKVYLNSKSTLDVQQRNYLIKVSKIAFLLLSFIFFIFWIASYEFFLLRLVENDDASRINFALILACALSCLSIYFQSYQSILEGTGYIISVQKISSFSHILGSVIVLILSSFGHDFLSLVFIHQSIILLNFLIMRWFVKREGIYNSTIISTNEKKYFLKLIASKAKLSSYTSILSGLIKHVSVLVISSLFSGMVLSNFLITKRLFDIIETFSNSIFSVKNPSLIKKYSSKIYIEYFNELKKASYASIWLYLFGSIMFIFFGVNLVDHFSKETYSPELILVLVFFIAGLGSRLNALFLSICNHSNNVMEHKAISIYLVVFLLFTFSSFWLFGIYTIPIAAIVGAIINLPFTISKAKRYTLAIN